MKAAPSFLAAALIATAAPALAATSYTGTVAGGFVGATLTGPFIAADGSVALLDNTLSADFGISANLDTISWGHSTTGAVPQFSYLYFIPNPDGYDVAPDTPFKLGSIQYLNGTSDLDTLIFGTTLHIDLGNGIDLKDIPITILTTQNANVSAARDADFISFGSDIPLTFNVFESGLSRADLYGQIVGDPQFFLTDLTITPGFEPFGFIGTGQPPLPEPASWAMMLGGFALLGGVVRGRRMRASVAFG